jgi:hypothetical protein
MYSTVHRVPADVQHACTPVRYTVPVYGERTEYSPGVHVRVRVQECAYRVQPRRTCTRTCTGMARTEYVYSNGAYAYSSGSYVNSASRYAYSIGPDREPMSSPAFARRCGVEASTNQARTRHMHAVISRDIRRHSQNVTRLGRRNGTAVRRHSIKVEASRKSPGQRAVLLGGIMSVPGPCPKIVCDR